MSQRRDTLTSSSGIPDALTFSCGRSVPSLCSRSRRSWKAWLTGNGSMLFLDGAGGSRSCWLRNWALRIIPLPQAAACSTDPNLASRIKLFYNGLFSFGDEYAVADLRLLAAAANSSLTMTSGLFLDGTNKKTIIWKPCAALTIGCCG